MPNQNLPKPNLPGQSSLPPSAPAMGLPSQPSMSNSSPDDLSLPKKLESPAVMAEPKSPSSAIPQPTLRPVAQSVPGGLSRENPAGTPPGMTAKVEAPDIQLRSSVAPKSALEMDQGSNLMPNPNAETKPVNEPKDMFAEAQKIFSAQSSVAEKSAPQSSPSSLNQEPKKVPQPMSATPIAEEKTKVSTSNPIVSPSKGQPSSPNVVAPENIAAKSPSGIQKFLNKKLLIFLGVAVVILVLVLILSSVFNKNTTSKESSTGNNSSTTTSPVTLTYWGLWEDSQIIEEIIADYEASNPQVKIDYRKQTATDYRERLQQAISSGNGPDIFRYHSTWVPMLGSSLATFPSSVMTASEFKTTFYPVAAEQLQYNGQFVGVPLMYDGLALLYNKDMLKTADIQVPTTWAELKDAANKLTVPTAVGERSDENITQAGLAIGNAGNVDNFSDILALLILQNGGNPAKADTKYVSDALTFYTNFVTQDRVWSSKLPNSTVAFARGEVAMIFAPSWRIHDIKNLNPNLDFGVAQVPQLDSANPVTWATFWAEGVNVKSKNQTEAWKFLKYLSSQEVLRKFYASASKQRNFGEIYPRQDMASELQSDPYVSAYLADAPYAKSWYLTSFTHDNGLDDQAISYYENAVTAVLSGKSVAEATKTLTTAIPQLLAKYGISQ
jgi:multiple sugar transport system substrate-binding protein